jgi:hypothetical protein
MAVPSGQCATIAASGSSRAPSHDEEYSLLESTNNHPT